MTTRNLLAAVAALIVVAAPTVRAYTVHFSFSDVDPESTVTFVADPAAGVPWEESIGHMTHFDIFYDPATATPLGFGEFRFNDPAKSFWRARVETPELGVFIVQRPLGTDLRTSEHSLQISRLEYLPGGVELLDFDATFTDQLTSGYQLPGALFSAMPTVLTRDPELLRPGIYRFNGSYFQIEGLAYQYGGGIFNHSEVEIIGAISAVPEPSTFAAAGVALLGLVVAFRRLPGLAPASRFFRSSR